MTAPTEPAGESRCDARIGWASPDTNGPDPLVAAACGYEASHKGPHSGDWRHGFGTPGVTSVTWEEGDRRSYRGNWQRCDARIPSNGPRHVDWVAAHRCLLPENHDGRHE